jgi:transposase
MKIIPLYLPLYTPQWQPIEYVFGTIKRYYRSFDFEDGLFEERVISSICLADTDFGTIFNHCMRLAIKNILNDT